MCKLKIQFSYKLNGILNVIFLKHKWWSRPHPQKWFYFEHFFKYLNRQLSWKEDNLGFFNSHYLNVNKSSPKLPLLLLPSQNFHWIKNKINSKLLNNGKMFCPFIQY